MISPVRIADHLSKAKGRLREQYKGMGFLEGFIDLIVKEIQILEDCFIDVMEKDSLYVAIGASLDGWGQILNTPRRGLSDENYRLILLGQVAVNVSRGTPEDMISVFKLFTQPQYVSLLEVYPANIQLTSVGGNPIGAIEDIKNAIRKAAPAGVSIDLFTTAPGNPFVFDGDPDPFGQGFGDVNDPEVGGYFVEIF